MAQEQSACGEVLKLKSEIEYLSKLIGEHKDKSAGYDQQGQQTHSNVQWNSNHFTSKQHHSTSQQPRSTSQQHRSTSQPHHSTSQQHRSISQKPHTKSKNRTWIPGTSEIGKSYVSNTTQPQKDRCSVVTRSSVVDMRPRSAEKIIESKPETNRRTVQQPKAVTGPKVTKSRVVVKPRILAHSDVSGQSSRIVCKPSATTSSGTPGKVDPSSTHLTCVSRVAATNVINTSSSQGHNTEKQSLRSSSQPHTNSSRQVLVSRASVLSKSGDGISTVKSSKTEAKSSKAEAISSKSTAHRTVKVPLKSTISSTGVATLISSGEAGSIQVSTRTVVPPLAAGRCAKTVAPLEKYSKVQSVTSQDSRNASTSSGSVTPLTGSSSLPGSPMRSSHLEVISKSRYKLIRTPTKNDQVASKISDTIPLAQNHRKINRHLSAPGSIQHVSTKTTPVKLEHRGKYKLVKSPKSSNQSELRPSKTWNARSSEFHWRRKSVTQKIPAASLISPISSRSSTSIRHKSRYKLVKKAIETTHKKHARQSLSPKNKFKYVAPKRERRLSRSAHRSATKKVKDKKEWTRKYSLKRDNTDSSGMPQFLTINQVLGRHVVNLSRDKFKFINATTKGKLDAHKQRWRHLNSRNRSTKIDRRSRLQHKRPHHRSNSHQSPHMTLIRNSPVVRRSPYVLHRHLPTISHSTVKRIINRATKVDRTRDMASRVLQKSIYTAHMAKFKKVNNKPGKKTYCLYYNRFGKCNRGTSCQYLHDPDRVAICTRFLRGRCEVSNCPFSHKVSKEKMPVCGYFLRGVCSRDNCLYLHSNVSRDAKICEEFLQGYCALGDQCKKKHSLICPEFKKDGQCPRGKKCNLKHVRKGTQKRKNPVKAESTSAKVSKTDAPAEEDFNDINLPMSERYLPSYIALDSSIEGANTSQYSDGASLLIHPRLSIGDESID